MKITNQQIAERVFGLKIVQPFSDRDALVITNEGPLKDYLGDICAAWEIIDEINKKTDKMKNAFDKNLFALLNNELLGGMDATIQVDPIRMPRYLTPRFISLAGYTAMGGVV